MNMKEYAFGIDLGGTTAKVGLFTTAGALLEKWEVPTDTSNAGEHILGNLAKAVKDKMQENGITAEQVEGVGVGVPGPVLDSRIVPIVCANLGGWGERNVSIQLSGLLDGMKVLAGNDANVAALGEIWMGTAKGCRSAVMVTLGTGVGGGVVLGGKLLTGYTGAAAEPGHMVILDTPNAPRCTCGRPGCLESLASATALIRMTKEAMAAHPESALHGLAAQSGGVNGRTAFDAAAQGDAAGKAVVEQYIHYLAVGVANMINIFCPEVIGLSGGVANQGENLLAPLRAAVGPMVFGNAYAQKHTRITTCTLGYHAGVIGAALLVKNQG